MNHPQLIEILDYQNEDILSRFTDIFAVSEGEAAEIFTETKKFLYVCREPGVFIPDELLIVDEMWHNFILFTKAYQQFCSQYFGSYVHHLPASKAEKEQGRTAMLEDPEKATQLFNDKLSTVISVVYDKLGRDTVIKWFREYPQLYSKDRIKSLRRL
jgi:hypothetical protein